MKPVSYTHLDVYKRQAVNSKHAQSANATRRRMPLSDTRVQRSCGILMQEITACFPRCFFLFILISVLQSFLRCV